MYGECVDKVDVANEGTLRQAIRIHNENIDVPEIRSVSSVRMSVEDVLNREQ